MILMVLLLALVGCAPAPNRTVAPASASPEFLKKHEAMDPWPEIQKLRALTALDLEDKLCVGKVYISGSVEDIYEENLRRWVVIRGDSNAAKMDFVLRGDPRKIRNLQALNQETGADSFSVIAHVWWVKRMNEEGQFTATGELVDFAMNPRQKKQVHESGPPDYSLNN